MGLMIDKPYYAVVLSGVQDHNDQPLDYACHPLIPSRALGCGVELVALSAHMYLIFSHRPEQIRQMAELIRKVGLGAAGTPLCPSPAYRRIPPRRPMRIWRLPLPMKTALSWTTPA